jgi:hypothetical protein
MYRLHGQDATWLYKETLTTPMHTLKIFLLELGPEEPLVATVPVSTEGRRRSNMAVARPSEVAEENPVYRFFPVVLKGHDGFPVNV